MRDKKYIRNLAIIAHVDHGKTTLVDALLKAGGMIRANQDLGERVMDSNDLERERGITILSKNTAIKYGDYKINIIDTPGHADFGGEVERVLKMCDGVILVVDAFEGPMPQTKFVLRKAVEGGLPAIICINKVDRPDQRVAEVREEIYDLFLSIDAPLDYLDSPVVYASARDSWALDDNGWQAMGGDEAAGKMDVAGLGMKGLLDTIIENIPCPQGDPDGPFRCLISTADYNDYVGRIGIGKIERGKLSVNDEAVIVNIHQKDKNKKVRITSIFEFDGLKRVAVEESSVGSIVAISGLEGIDVGDTICCPQDPIPLPFLKISEPTLQMLFSVNDSPFAGMSGKYLTSRHLRDRLMKEVHTDVSLRVEDGDTTESFRVSGRGELHLSVLIENMRREGYEFLVSKPEVLFKESAEGKKMEPMEIATIDVDQEYAGTVIQAMGRRKGVLKEMKTSPSGYSRLIFRLPARGLVGYRQQLMTDSRGTGVLNSEFDGYDLYQGEMPGRVMGSLIVYESGETSAYGLHAAQERGQLFLSPGVQVYEGQIAGANPKGEDIEVNVCRKKALTNIRSSASDEALKLTPPLDLSLEQMMEFIEEDERIEVTPAAFRMRKAILNHQARYKAAKRAK